MYPGSEDPFAIKITLSGKDSYVIPCFRRKLAKGIISKYECGPGGLYAGPLGFDGQINHTQIQSIKNALESELTNFSFRLNPFMISNELVLSNSNSFTQVVDLTNRESYSSDLQKNGVTYDARLAQKKGLQLQLEDIVDLKNFIQVYSAIRQSWENPGTFYPAEFFDNLTTSKHCDFWSVLQDGDYIGGSIILKGPNHVSSWLTIIHPDYRNSRPYEYVYRHFIDYYSEAGFRYFDFNPSAGLEGVIKFKEKFGTIRAPFLQIENQSVISSVISAIRGELS